MNISENISLKPYNSFGIDVLARQFAAFSSLQELEEILDRPLPKQILVLGGGSNILFTKNVDGLVLKNEIKGIDLVKEDEAFYYVKAAAGENWHSFVQYCLQHHHAGVENLSLIPGNVGAAPIQNIGAYGVEIKDVFIELEAYHLKEKRVHRLGLHDCAFGYRDSVFKTRHKGEYIILNASFRLHKKPVFNISYGAIEQELEKMKVQAVSAQAISEAVIRIRRSKLPDPLVIGNAGSFFKNPLIPLQLYTELTEQHPTMPGFIVGNTMTKVPAGWLIEQCGWKGYRKGDAGCYEKQALVLVNYGNATGEEIYSLSEEIVNSVANRFGISLSREVNIF